VCAPIALLLAAVLAALWARPPELIRIAANYSAKIVCSGMFVAGRDPMEVLHDDVQALGNPILGLMRISVDRERRVVRAGLLGFIGGGMAAMRTGEGCAAVPDGNLGAATVTATPTAPAPATEPAAATDQAAATEPAAAEAAPDAAVRSSLALPMQDWPDGDAVQPDPAIQRLILDDELTGPGLRALVVVHRGRIVGERYTAGFTAHTPLLGWSMTKSVTAGLIGLLVKDGRLTLGQAGGWPAAAGDGRDKIRIADLMAMASGLRFNEGYGAVSDVTRMLYLEPDMAAFARAQPLAHPPGDVWSYSSGTAVILSRIFQDTLGAQAESFVRARLFKPLGMASAMIETDEHGTLVGSSYMYASARDWARYGLFLLQGGVWQGHALLPPDYVSMMAAPVAASGGRYGHGMVWLWGSDGAGRADNPDAAFGVPADTFWMEGHDGQYVAIIPSRALVVVRMGYTPSGLKFKPQPLVRALLGARAPAAAN
jgi:CubicO group peptidase (beta-lactamase class C family)